MHIKPLIKSMRLRTLPLSLGGVLCGGLLGMAYGGGSGWLLLLTALTACALQVLSNLSNELGDYRNGIDRANDRQGPAYSLLEGGLSEQQMVAAIRGTAVVCCVLGLAMVWGSCGTLLAWQPLALLVLGAAAIWAATHYTLGKNPYGYRGLGDIFVFIFFGLVSVMGSYLVVGHFTSPAHSVFVVLPAIGMGLLSVAVLNVNNIRDMESDRGTRVTTPLRLGERWAKVYQTLLVVLGVACFALGPGILSVVVTAPFFLWHIIGVWRRHGRQLDKMLPLLVLSSFALAVLYGNELKIDIESPYPIW